jgi:hypothetical protein
MIGLQREVDQLTWQFHLDSVSPKGKSDLMQVPFHWADEESYQLLVFSERNSTGHRLSQKGGKENCNNFWCACVNEQPTLSLFWV